MNENENYDREDLIDSENNDCEENHSNYTENHKSRKRIIALVSIILTLFIVAIKFSPISSYFNNITGTNSKYSNYETLYDLKDEGIKLAIKNNFIQDIGISDEYDDLVFTVDSLIFDGRRMVLFYTIENKGDHKYIEYFDFDILDDKGEHLPASYGHPYYDDTNLNEVRKIHDTFDLSLSPEMEVPDSIQIKVKIRESVVDVDSRNEFVGRDDEEEYSRSKELPYTWDVTIPLDKELFKNEKITYDINETVEIAGQKLYFDRLTVYPITSILHLRYDVNNSMNIFSVEDLRIVDNNREWQNGLNGLISSNPDDFRRDLYFESNYFTRPDSVHIMGNGIKAIDKEKIDVVVDIEKTKLLNSPDRDFKFREVENRPTTDTISLVFEYPDEGLSFSFDFKDAEGNILRADSLGHSSTENSSQIFFMIPKDLDYVNPITLTLSNYPNVINKQFKVEVKAK
ncbi:DUF4179 domain-containing protein [Wukongibacter baidiensis]|uniref:DUF4179 domain-containing protein n=1 Tax=Wukongibacter baidiensis TaxID=1723361 RepID=UPI003D7FADF7